MGVNEELMRSKDIDSIDEYVEDDEVPLPGFRFHPTDEELVTFYLRRKLEKKPIAIFEQLIKQIDIYRYDPWDLPIPSNSSSVSSGSAEKEGYFFCRRGRKYRNSVRPNRVTGSGFWKATGIDKPVYSHGGEGNDCVGLKKTLVYYHGSAGKGTKTEWMMHEFRLPSSSNNNTTTDHAAANTNLTIPYAIKNHHADDLSQQEAEIWTLCRIFKRNVSQRKHMLELKQLAAKRQSISRSMNSSVETNQQITYINFGASLGHDHYHNIEQKPTVVTYNHTITSSEHHQRNNIQFHHVGQLNSSPVVAQQQPQLNNIVQPSSNSWNIKPAAANDFTFDNWDELGSVVKFAVDDSHS